MKISKFNIVKAYGDSKIIYNTLTDGILLLNSSDIKLLDNLTENYFNTKNQAEQLLLDNLIKGRMIVEDDCDEIDYLRTLRNQLFYSTDELLLTIAPTLNCNFDCPYCYEKGRRSNTMDEKTIDQTINFILALAEDKEVINICWYGGEPLLKVDIIEKISKEVLKRKAKTTEYFASIVTNGYYLDQEMARRLKELAVHSAQITIDGDEKTHNSRRKLKNGKETYQRIINNIKEVANTLNINIRMNIDRTNKNAPYKLMQNIDPQIKELVNLYLAPITESDNNRNPLCLGKEEFAHLNLDFKQNYEKTQNFFNNTDLHIEGCGATVPDSFVIGPLGELYKCWNHIGDKKKQVGHVKTGVKFNYLMNKFINEDPLSEKCYNCPVLPLCFGGCADYRQLKDGRDCCEEKYIIEDKLINFVKKKLESEVINE